MLRRDELHVFVVSRHRFEAVKLPISKKVLTGTVNFFFNALNNNNFERILRLGGKLYQSLIKPLQSAIKEARQLIIVPDGVLAKIPFEALVSHFHRPDEPVYLIEQYPVSYVQSASVPATLRKHYRRNGTGCGFAGFGDPLYKGNMTRLKGSGQEVEGIAGLFRKNRRQSSVYLRDQATEANAKAATLKSFDYIHFSCHGILDGSYQGLVLSQIPGDREDGLLTLNEIMNCDYNAKLVVLSACHTGSGKFQRAKGVTGLTRAVMYAGTPAVIAGLWSVDEAGTKELMLNFYTNLLKKNMINSEALRQAKLTMIKEMKYFSPYFRSAFVLYGE